MDTDTFIIHSKTEDVSEDIGDGVEKRYDTSNYAIERPLTSGKNTKVIGLVKNELRAKIVI